MTFDQKKLALMLAWVVTVLLCGAIVSVTSSAGWVALVGLALVPAAVVFRLLPPRRKRCRTRPTGRAEADYFQVISMPKKCMNTWRAGRFFGFGCGLRM